LLPYVSVPLTPDYDKIAQSCKTLNATKRYSHATRCRAGTILMAPLARIRELEAEVAALKGAAGVSA
jgi:hypothetical protein